MRLRRVWGSLAAGWVSVACSSAASGPTGALGTGCLHGACEAASVSCSATVAQAAVCYTYANLTASQVASAKSTCTGSLGGTVATACPAAGAVGCCSYTSAGQAVTACIYCGPPAEDQLACASNPDVQGATWTAGSGGAATCGGDAGASGVGDAAAE